MKLYFFISGLEVFFIKIFSFDGFNSWKRGNLVVWAVAWPVLEFCIEIKRGKYFVDRNSSFKKFVCYWPSLILDLEFVCI